MAKLVYGSIEDMQHNLNRAIQSRKAYFMMEFSGEELTWMQKTNMNALDDEIERYKYDIKGKEISLQLNSDLMDMVEL